MSAAGSRSIVWPLLVAGAVLAIAVPARAATFGVSPVDVTLVHGDRSHLIVVTNEDSVPLRFQLDGYRWDERPDGEMALEPSDDLIFFPRLFEVQPRETQNIRVGVMAPEAADEKTYRLVIHQLKPFAPGTQAAAGGDRETSVSILTNVSIPVFVEPAMPAAQASVGPLSMVNGTLKFTVSNSGNAHFRIAMLRLDGFAGGAAPVFSTTAKGWYVLAHGTRNYSLAVPRSDCLKATRLKLSIQTDHGNLGGDLMVTAAECGAS